MATKLCSAKRAIARPPRGVASFFSCSGGERSFEHKDIKHGVFTYNLLKALRGDAKDADGEVTFEGMVSHVKKNTPKTVAQLMGSDRKQSPEMSAQGLSGDTVLFTSSDLERIRGGISQPSNPLLSLWHECTSPKERE